MRLDEAFTITAHPEDILTEGIGDLVVRAVTATTGGGLGYAVGVAVGSKLYYSGIVYSIILALGVASPAAVLFGVTTATAGAGIAAFMIAGDAAGKWVNRIRSKQEPTHIIHIRELIRVTRERDDVIKGITSVMDAKKNKSKLDSLTSSQKTIAIKLVSALADDRKNGLISDDDFKAANAIANTGKAGKLSYIEKK